MGAGGIWQDERGWGRGGQDTIILRWTTGRLGLKWLSLAYYERPVHNWYQLGLYCIPVKPGKIGILNIVQRQWGGRALCSLC